MSLRNNLTFSSNLKSDCAALNKMIESLCNKFSDDIRFIRDATRGGVASVLNEITSNKDFSIRLDEDQIPVSNEVRGICDILGLDPLYVANEGKIVIVASQSKASDIISEMKKFPEASHASIIGDVDSLYPGKVYIETFVGGKRLLPLLVEEQLPRIC
jgi:hydrogenase expression/formation protein HypE